MTTNETTITTRLRCGFALDIGDLLFLKNTGKPKRYGQNQ
jgi:hypothetical protein